ncbi:MAG: Lrp/AsnC family transcriptional regulator [Chloroflexi bacterium]|nr:Lrp/AsnC family transcriptional regulator [Chloroflexota bacterium]
MATNLEKLLDRTGWRILHALQTNARISFSELGRRVSLTSSGVTERVQKMEDAGVITGYHAWVNASKLGLPITAFIRVTTPAERYPSFVALVDGLAEVLECHHVTGSESFILKVAVSSVAHLETLIAQLSPYGQTATSIVLSSPIGHRILNER